MSGPSIDDALKAMGGPGGPLAGLDVSDPAVRAEAEKVWGMLNNLSENNPKDYKKFLKKNLREGAREAEREALEKQRESALRKGATLFVTTAEELRTQSGPTSSSSKGIKASVREVAVCLWRKPGLRPPKGPLGLPFTGEESDYIKCEFPLRLLKPSPRILLDRSEADLKKNMYDVAASDGAKFAYDVEMHPKVVDCAAMNLKFRGFIMEVVFQWIEHVHGTKLNRTGRKVRVRREDLERSRSALNLGLDYEIEDYDSSEKDVPAHLSRIVDVIAPAASSTRKNREGSGSNIPRDGDVSSDEDGDELVLDRLHEKFSHSSGDPDKVLIQELCSTSPPDTFESLEVLD